MRIPMPIVCILEFEGLPMLLAIPPRESAPAAHLKINAEAADRT